MINPDAVLEPEYYSDFVCLASECPEHCCQGWNIEIDPDTENGWGSFTDNIETMETGRFIRLNPEGKCPFLTETGLCGMFLKYGERMMPEICRNFPRQPVSEEGTEIHSLSLRCPAVLDLLWQKNSFAYKNRGEKAAFSVKPLLDHFLAVGNGEQITGGELLFMVFDSLFNTHLTLSREITLDENGFREYGTEYFTKEALRETIGYFEMEARASMAEIRMRKGGFSALHQLLIHAAKGFSEHPIYGKDLIRYQALSESLCKGEISVSAKLYAEFLSKDEEGKLRLLVMEELFASVLTPEAGDCETVLLHLQWLILRYVILRYVLFLCRCGGERKDDRYMKILISRIFRITELSDIQKLLFFDPRLLGWLRSPEEIGQWLFPKML